MQGTFVGMETVAKEMQEGTCDGFLSPFQDSISLNIISERTDNTQDSKQNGDIGSQDAASVYVMNIGVIYLDTSSILHDCH